MKTPESLETLVDYGIIQQVVRPLMSGKEAQVFVVVVEGQECVAKVYKEATQRTFKHRVEYTEGRKTRNTRDQRAINKRTRHGKKQDEAAWRNAEVETLYVLKDGGVRVPDPINYVDGVLVMELVKDAEGDAAPRLGDLEFSPEDAYVIYKKLIREVIRMLCVGIVHGDLSEFNVLMAAEGPVVIDFPQSIDPAKNTSARKLLLRDVENLHRFLSRHAPEQPIRPLGEEMWALYEKNRLDRDTELLGDYQAPTGPTDVSEVLSLIDEAKEEHRDRTYDDEDDHPAPSYVDTDVDSEAAPSESSRPPMRRVVDFTQGKSWGSAAKRPDRSRPGKKNRGAAKPSPATSGTEERSRKPRPSRSRRKSPPTGPASQRDEQAPAAPTRRRSRTSLRDAAQNDAAATPASPSSPTPNGSGPAPGPKRKRRRRRRAPQAENSAKSPAPGESSKNPARTPRPPRGRRAPAPDNNAPSRGPKSDSGPASGADAPRPSRPRRRRPRKPRASE